MDAGSRATIAYSLLPPPLSALPAKYWTSISLLVHGYSVGALFQELVAGVGECAGDAPGEDEAFILGFIHDLGQKLGVLGKASLKRVEEWVKDRLELLGVDGASRLARYVRTNPAETMADPSYPGWVWSLLRFADRVQGSSSPADMFSLVEDLGRDLNKELHATLLNVNVPHVYLRAAISYYVYRELRSRREELGVLTVISTPFGMLVVSEKPLQLTVEWREFAERGFFGEPIIHDVLADKLAKFAECCDQRACVEEHSKKGEKSKDPTYSGFKKKDCEKSVLFGRKVSAYEVTLLYYGGRNVDTMFLGSSPVLPSDVSVNLGFEGVDYRDGGKFTCVICGLKTESAVTVGYAKTLAELVGARAPKTEKWTRRSPPRNLNQLFGSLNEGSMCPLCMGDYLLYLRMVKRSTGSDVVSASFSASTSAIALEDLARILGALVSGGIDVDALESPDSFAESLEDVLNIGGNFYTDWFSSRIFAFGNFKGRGEERIVNIVSRAGLVISAGLYPLTVSDHVPLDNPGTLFRSDIGVRSIYSYSPADRNLGRYTPFVALAMAFLGELGARKGPASSAPTVLGVLDYPPSLAPLMAQYASPSAYSELFHVISMLEEVV